LPPLLQLVVFGYAVTLDVDHARIGWMDMDNTPESRALEARFEGSGRFDVVATPRSEQETQSLLDRGQVHGVVRVLPGSRATWRAAHDRSAGAARWHQLQHRVAGVGVRPAGDREFPTM
jgi:hypothetical protein